MAKIRRILRPAKEGKHVTLAEARAVFRELKRTSRSRASGTATSRQKPVAKAG
jgi:hypothetical protein